MRKVIKYYLKQCPKREGAKRPQFVCAQYNEFVRQEEQMLKDAAFEMMHELKFIEYKKKQKTAVIATK